MPAGLGGGKSCLQPARGWWPGWLDGLGRAEVLGVVRGAVGGVDDADGERLGAAVEQVGAVARRLQPGVDDLAGAAVAPGDVLAARGGVAGGAGPRDEGRVAR